MLLHEVMQQECNSKDFFEALKINEYCDCRLLERELLEEKISQAFARSSLSQPLSETHPHLFAETMIFLPSAVEANIKKIVSAISNVFNMSAWQVQAITEAPLIAQHNPGSLGVFQSFDFHLGERGPQLIEINTNAGGALLSAVLSSAQKACCDDVQPHFNPRFSLIDSEKSFIDMFIAEWLAQGKNGQPTTIAIVDEEPEQQYLYPEFCLFQNLFKRFGIKSIIADPKKLQWRDGRLFCEGEAIDMVYNRLTDFYFEEPASQALRKAYEANAVVVTPHPYAHALYADKRHLITLSNEDSLKELGVAAEMQALICSGIPQTLAVTHEQAEEFWVNRSQFFFKPVGGFGGRAAYRGDKITHKTWSHILSSPYVAQRVVKPGERLVKVNDNLVRLKFDIRAFTYRGEVQLLAARLYSGQTTNFRSLGGGLAPVFITAD